MAFVNAYRAEQKERRLTNNIQRMAMLPEDRLNQLDLMLSAKRKVRESTSSKSKLGGIMKSLGGNNSYITSKINNCLSSIDKTIDNNIIGLLGAAYDAAGITDLLIMQEVLGRDFSRLMRSLGNLQNFGDNALYQLQDAFARGVQNTIIDAVAMATDVINDTIDELANEAFAALLPALDGLQSELGSILGEVTNAGEAVSALMQEITGDINNLLRTVQGEFNDLSRTISNGLFDYASTRGTTCASRPDSQNGLRSALNQIIY